MESILLPPKQRRSQARLDRVVAAAVAMLNRGVSYEALTMADVAREAGVSVGAIYTRFPSKEHLLAHLAHEWAVEAESALAEALPEGAGGTLTMQEVLELYFAVGARLFAKHRSVLRPLSLIVRATSSADLRDAVRQFNTKSHGRLRELLLGFGPQITHGDPAAAVDFAILAGSAALRELVLYQEPVSDLVPDVTLLARELARVCLGYLTLGSHA